MGNLGLSFFFFLNISYETKNVTESLIKSCNQWIIYRLQNDDLFYCGNYSKVAAKQWNDIADILVL